MMNNIIKVLTIKFKALIDLIVNYIFSFAVNWDWMIFFLMNSNLNNFYYTHKMILISSDKYYAL